MLQKWVWCGMVSRAFEESHCYKAVAQVNKGKMNKLDWKNAFFFLNM